MLLGAGYNTHYFGSDASLEPPEDVALVELGLGELLAKSKPGLPLSLHLARTPVTEDSKAQAHFVDRLGELVANNALRSIGIHLMGARTDGIGRYGFSTQFDACEEATDRATAFIRRLQKTLGIEVWLENANFYTMHSHDIERNWRATRRIIDATGSLVILDASHVLIEAHNLNIPGESVIGFIPWSAVAEIHLSGIQQGADDASHDAHGLPVSERAWEWLDTLEDLGLLDAVRFLTVEHTDPTWVNSPEAFYSDFDRARAFTRAVGASKYCSKIGSKANSYAISYLVKIIRGHIDGIEEACSELGVTLKNEITDWIADRDNTPTSTLVLSREELLLSSTEAAFAPDAFLDFFQARWG